MTVAQEIFVVFYAIFWGAVFSVQGRWRMFQPLAHYPHVRHRLVLSILLLDVVPIIFFAWIFFRLRGTPDISPSDWSFCETLLQISAGVLPAFAIFAFYRLWMAIVAFAPRAFYESEAKQNPDLKGIDPPIEELHIEHTFKGWPNLLFAVVYFVVASVGPCLR